MIKLICEVCKKEFYVKPYRKKQAKYCSYKCKNINQKGCIPICPFKKGNIPWNKGKKRPPFSKEWREKMRRTGPEHGSWKGGRYKDTDGYIYVWQPSHPRANCRDYILNSHLVMEKILGRYLTPIEVVHHRNGIKNDDRPENLRLFANQSEHWKFHRRFSP